MSKRKRVAAMGNANVKVHPERAFPKRENFDFFDIEDDCNGFVIGKVPINEDVLISILTSLPLKTVLRCRLVCKTWCNIIDSRVFKEKLIGSQFKDVNVLRNVPWHIIFVTLHKQLLRRNFIKNPCGAVSLRDWDIKSNGGDRFIIEQPPSGTSGDPPAPSCFTTSYHSCGKQQIIDLYAEGAWPAVMDVLKPNISVSEWYAGRWDCWAVYDIEVALLDSQLNVIDRVEERKHCGGNYGSDWHKVEFLFNNVGSNVRYVKFYHGGADGQFWAGHYGSKMTASSVQLILEEHVSST